MITGGVTAVGGLLVMQIPDNCEDKLLCIENEEIGMVLLVAGLLTFALGAAQVGLQERTKPPPANAPPAPFPIAPDPTAEEQPVVVINPNEPPLPATELSYSDPTQRQFAFQASSAARRGNCQAAIASGKHLQIEVEQKLLAVDDAYARCVSGQ